MGGQAGVDGAEVECENRAGLTPEQLRLLWADLGRLADVGPDLAEPAVRHAVDGTDADVLPRLRGTPGGGRALGLHACVTWQQKGGDRKARRNLLRSTPRLPADVLRRLAAVYDAAATPDRIANHWASKSTPAVPLPSWVDLLLSEASTDTDQFTGGFSVGGKRVSLLPADLFEQTLVAAGEPADLLARAAFISDVKHAWQGGFTVDRITSLLDVNPMFLRHPGAVAEALAHPDAAVRLHALELLAKRGLPPAGWAAAIVGLAIGPAKTVRKGAEPLLEKMPAEADRLLRERATTGSNDERLLAAQILWRHAGEAARPFLAERVKAEKTAKVRTGLSELLAEGAAPRTASPEAVAELPPVAPVEPCQPLSPAARAALREVLQAGWEAHRKGVERWQKFQQAHPRAGGHKHELQPPPGDADLAAMVRWVEGPEPVTADGRPKHLFLGQDAARKFVARPDVSLLHAVRIAAMHQNGNDFYFRNQLRQSVTRFYHAHQPRPTLRDVAATLQAVGRSPLEVFSLVVESGWWGGAFLDFDPADVWPYFVEHGDRLENAWHGKEQFARLDDMRRKVIFRLLAMFPQLPPRFVRLCYDIAFNGTKKERPLARAALANDPARAERCLASLGGGKAEHRAIAAEWLGEMGHAAAIPAIKKALGKEKQEVAAGQMMLALEKLGVPLEQFVSLDGLLKEARALLDKGVPKELAWLDLDRLPKVRWAATGKPVRTEILKWMVVQSHKLGSPEPGPRLRQYTSHFDRGNAAELGQYVLESWIAQDTVPHTHEAADKFAQQHVAQMTRGQASHPQYYKGTPDEWYRSAYNQKIAEPVGTANGEKGVLAVAGACCDGRAGPPVERFLRTYYGYRVHQCKALIRMLSWVEQPSAIQVLLSVSNRFRTAGIRKEAEAVVTDLADRKGWTIDELADRTIPTGGFDDGLSLTLDYGGERRFVAKLDGEFNVLLSTSDGKPIKSLPAPRQDEDADRAKVAKKALAAAKKEVESVLKLQKERLYEGMCTQRTWAFADWDAFLNRHAIVRRYCQRLVWGVVVDGKVTTTFRPLDDGTLTDTADDAVTVPPQARIVLPHVCTTPPDVAKAWQQHLADYDVKPLFEQFAKAAYALPADKRQETTVADFNGHLVEAFKLRGRLTKQGYTRGAAQDGGWFHDYHKHFPSLGLTATVGFTGSPLPEENRTVAITTLHFARKVEGQESTWAGPDTYVPLGEVPAVLLSECWNDARLAAAEGSGFDPEWEKKSGY